MTRAQLCSALNKRFCYRLALPCPFFGDCTEQGSGSDPASLIPKHTPTSRGRQAGTHGGRQKFIEYPDAEGRRERPGAS